MFSLYERFRLNLNLNKKRENVYFLCDSRPEVSNSNPHKGHISFQKCSTYHTLNEKWFCGPQFLEEGSPGPHMLHKMTFFERNAGHIGTLGGQRV